MTLETYIRAMSGQRVDRVDFGPRIHTMGIQNEDFFSRTRLYYCDCGWELIVDDILLVIDNPNAIWESHNKFVLQKSEALRLENLELAQPNFD